MAFTLKSRIGRGRTTETFLARLSVANEELDVAVKRPRSEYAGNDAFVSAFLRWGEDQIAVEHPNVVGVLEAGRTEDGGAYVIQDHIDGVSLAEVLAALAKKKRTMSMKLTLSIAERIAEVLEALHGRNLAHGGLDPHEVLISHRGVVKVGDQRLRTLDVHLGADLAEERSLTGLYRAPECAENSAPPSPPSDVYSLALVILECLIGRPVWTAPSMTVAAAISALRDFTHVGQAQPLLTEDLTAILLGSTIDNPIERVPNGKDLHAGLSRVIKKHKLETSPQDLAMFLAALFPGPPSGEAPTAMVDAAALAALERARNLSLERLEGTSNPVDPDLEQKAFSRLFPASPNAGPSALPDMAPLIPPPAPPPDMHGAPVAPSTRKTVPTVPVVRSPQRQTTRLEMWLGAGVIVLIIALLGVHMATRNGKSVHIVEVQLSSDPSGAAVWLDGERIGTTPLKTTFPARGDAIELRFERDGYLPLAIERKVQGDALRYEARLSPE